MCESLDHLHRFPSGTSSIAKDWINRKPPQTGLTIQDTIIDAYRDARPFTLLNKKCDKIMAYSQEMHDIKQKLKIQLGSFL